MLNPFFLQVKESNKKALPWIRKSIIYCENSALSSNKHLLA